MCLRQQRSGGTCVREQTVPAVGAASVLPASQQLSDNRTDVTGQGREGIRLV